jgi:hypothetical protein
MSILIVSIIAVAQVSSAFRELDVTCELPVTGRVLVVDAWNTRRQGRVSEATQ